MATVRLGKTEIVSDKNGFGALPIQRISQDQAVFLLRRAYAQGIRYFDTARAYSDSEQKIGAAFSSGERSALTIASKTTAQQAAAFWEDLHTSLKMLKTDYIDVMQFHNPAFCPLPGDESGLYDAALLAQQQGKIRHIAITNHRLHIAQQAVESGRYALLQFPLSYLSSPADHALIAACRKKDVGFVAMKALAGGLIQNSAAAYAYLDQYENVLPIWGVQREAELEEFLSYMQCPPTLNEELRAHIAADQKALSGNFCRACGYCLPCPAQIDIPTCARMSLLIRRAPSAQFLTAQSNEMMEKITACIACGACRQRCPYGLDTPQLLRDNLADYRRIVAGEISANESYPS